MDEDRRIRFLVSPLLFFASLSWGLLRDATRNLGDILPGLGLKLEKLPDLIALIAGGGIAVFTVGYVIGTTTYVLLRLAFIVAARFGYGSGSHEITLSDEVLRLVWGRIGAPGEPDRTKMFFAGSTFDHDVLQEEHKGVHQWIVRRWNAFSVAATSVTGLLLSLLAGIALRVRLTRGWWMPVVVTSIVLGVAAFLARRDTMGMLKFQAARQQRLTGRGDR